MHKIGIGIEIENGEKVRGNATAQSQTDSETEQSKMGKRAAGDLVRNRFAYAESTELQPLGPACLPACQAQTGGILSAVT